MKNKLLAALFLVFVSCWCYGQNITVDLPQNVSICSGASVELKPIVTGGTAPYTYLWSNGETSSAILVNKAQTYAVTVTDQANNTAHAQTVVTAAIAPNKPTATNTSGTICFGASAKLVASAPGGAYQWYDAAFNPLPSNGAEYNTGPITQNTVFYVETTINGCTSPRTAVAVILIDKPAVDGVLVCFGSTATFTARGAGSYQWYNAAGDLLPSNGATFTTGPLTQTTSFFVTGTTNGCTTEKVEARADVKAATPTPNGGGPYVVCTGSKITLSASGVNGAVYDWFDVPTGGKSIISSPDFTTPVLTADKTYYVEANIDGCSSDRIPVPITVSQPAEKPIPAASGPICYNSGAELSVTNAAPNVTYKWYTSINSTDVYRTGAVVTTDALLSTTTFYVRAESGACVSDPEPVTVTVKSAVVTPAVTGATTTCPGTTVTLTATAPSGNIFKWYDSATSAPVIDTNAVFSPLVNASRSFFVSVTASDGCESARTEVVITTIPPPAAPNATGGSTCIGGKAVLMATSGSNHRWYDSGGALLWSGPVFETPALTTTTDYFVSSVGANGCESTTRTTVTATVIAKPTAPNASGPPSPICEGTTATLTASGSTGSYRWWSAQTDGTLLASTATYTTDSLSSTQTFWLEALTPQGCPSDRSPVTVTVTSLVNPQFLYLSGTYCKSGFSDIPMQNIPGTFKSTPGLLINPTTGVINLAGSTVGHYTVTFTPPAGGCNTPTTTDINIISTTPNATFTYSAKEYCSDAANPFPIFTGTASAGFFSSSSGLVFANPSTGQVDLRNSTPGKYTITNTISNDCGADEKSFEITIVQGAAPYAGPDQIVPRGNSIVLSGSVKIPGLGVTWTSSNSADVFSDIHALNPTYTPAATGGTVTLTLTTDNPSGLCGVRSNQAIITIVNKPVAPTAGPVTICYGDSARLSATAPGGTYKWYGPTGSNSLGSGANFVTDPLTTGATFYVTTTINGIESDRTPVPVTVRAQVLAPTVTGGGLVCPGPVALTITETADEYRWYDADGNIQSISTTNPTYNITVTQNTRFLAEIVRGNCVSPRFPVDITIKPTAMVKSALNGQVCSGAQQSYIIMADIATATFTYSRGAVTGISNPAQPSVTATQITEPLFNTTNTEIPVVYTITPYLNGCAGPSFNYTVIVLPSPGIISSLTKTVCNRAGLDYFVQIASDATTHFSWSRAAVNGISNAAISGQESRTIRESLENTTNLPIDVVYTFDYGTATCPGAPFTLTVTVEPPVYVKSGEYKIVCAGEPVGYEIVSNVDDLGATFRWYRDGITTPGTSKTIDEILTNNTAEEMHVYYNIIPSLNGCDGALFRLHIILKPLLEKPVIFTNSPVCVNKEINLNVKSSNFTGVQGVRYLWTSSTGFSSETKDPFVSIPTTTAGSISFRVTVILGECSAVSDDTFVEVDQKPVANAGINQSVCPGATSIPLNGQVNGGLNGGPITGEWNIVSGTGSFQYARNQKDNVYFPSAADKAAGSVVLSLTSAYGDNCEVSISLVTFTFEPSPAANAGADREACSQFGVPLNGVILIASGTGSWKTAGDGKFDNLASLTALYTPGPNDIAAGSVKLTLTADGTGPCDIPSDEVLITFAPPPTVKADAQAVRYVVRGKSITLNPVVSDENVTYRWTPATGLNDPTIKHPVVATGDADTITYTLVVTNALGCQSAPASVLVRVTPQLTAPNTFTPNNDGINDLWLVQGIESYPKIVVDIYSRSGQPVYHSVGYTKPWDGTSNGTPAPFGVYYFVLDTRDSEKKITGYVTIVR